MPTTAEKLPVLPRQASYQDVPIQQNFPLPMVLGGTPRRAWMKRDAPESGCRICSKLEPEGAFPSQARTGLDHPPHTNGRQANRARTRSERQVLPSRHFPATMRMFRERSRMLSHALPFTPTDRRRQLSTKPWSPWRGRYPPTLGHLSWSRGIRQAPLADMVQRNGPGRLRHSDGRQEAAWAEASFSRPLIRSERRGNCRRRRP